MARMGKTERVQSVLNGQPPDRPPVSFWHHFREDQRAGDAAVDAHLDHLKTYDIDFLKVMYDLGYPHDGSIQNVDDLRRLSVLNGDEGGFGEHLHVIRCLCDSLNGRVLIATTLFNAWATFRRMLAPGAYAPGAGPSPVSDPKSTRAAEFLSQHREDVVTALRIIGESLCNFARRCIESGADGVFLSVRDDWVDELCGLGTYDSVVRDTDLDILEGAQDGRFNVLHVCGTAVNFDEFSKYPIHVINWADRTAGPSIRDVVGVIPPVLCAGLNQLATFCSNDPQACAAEARDAVKQAGTRPIIVGPGCTYDPDKVTKENLLAVRHAVEQLSA